MSLHRISSTMIDGAVGGGSGLPVGAVVFSPTGAVFPGFLELNGQSCVDYPDLRAFLGSDHVPDFRNRVPRHEGPLAGLSGTTQEDAFQGHRHDLKLDPTSVTISTGSAPFYLRSLSGSTNVNSETIGVKGASSDGVNGAPRIASETRAKAYIGKYLIKAASEVVNEGTLDMLVLAQTVDDKLSKANVVGLVSAGAVVESGKNANGSYTLFADGTATFYRVLDYTPPANALAQDYAIDYPTRLADIPSIVVCPQTNYGNAYAYGSAVEVYAAWARVRAQGSGGNSSTPSRLGIIGNGRWK